MTDDPLDKKTSVAVALTENGVTASAQSRTIAALDRLCGNLVDALNIPVERKNERARAKIAGEKMLINTIAEAAAEQLKVDPALADRAIEGHFGGILRKQENKDAVAREAMEQLRLSPPTSTESNSGPEVLDADFMNRIEQRAEGASSEELREKWARVLASEIRKPGTFSAKAMRVVDELTPETARLFEEFCRSRLVNVVPKALLPKPLEFSQVTRLTTADLLVDPGLTGQIRYFTEATDGDKTTWWLCRLGRLGVAFGRDVDYANTGALKRENEKPALEVYVLTEVGQAISTILDSDEESTFGRLVDYLHSKMPAVELREYAHDGEGYELRRILPASGG